MCCEPYRGHLLSYGVSRAGTTREPMATEAGERDNAIYLLLLYILLRAPLMLLMAAQIWTRLLTRLPKCSMHRQHKKSFMVVSSHVALLKE